MTAISTDFVSKVNDSKVVSPRMLSTDSAIALLNSNIPCPLQEYILNQH